VFEQSRSNVGQAWVDSAVSGASQGITIANNWFGDGTVQGAGTAWINTYGYGVNITGNMFGGTQQNGIIFNSDKGFKVSGNYVNGTYAAFINYLTSVVDGGQVTGNSYLGTGVTAFELNTGNKGANTQTNYNAAF
jgi:hypothetical protein